MHEFRINTFASKLGIDVSMPSSVIPAGLNMVDLEKIFECFVGRSSSRDNHTADKS